MSQCPGCGISYCLDCEKSVHPNLYRCEPCRVENELHDPFAITAREQAKELAGLEAAVRMLLEAVYVGDGKIICPPALLAPIKALVAAMEKQ